VRTSYLLWIRRDKLSNFDPVRTQSCGYAVPLYDFVMQRTQLLRISYNAENRDRTLATSRDSDRQSNDATGDDGDEASPFEMSLRAYWLFQNQNSVDGLPGLLKAPDAMLNMTPQSNFDKNSPRPMLRRSTKATNTNQDRKWFLSGFMLGAVTMLAIIRLGGGLKGNSDPPAS